VLPETGFERAREVAHKLRRRIADAPFIVNGQPIIVTASFGVCGLDRVTTGQREVAKRFFKIADGALYRSKGSGRNQVTAEVYPASLR
jgi:PleD family two-component response regulator